MCWRLCIHELRRFAGNLVMAILGSKWIYLDSHRHTHVNCKMAHSTITAFVSSRIPLAMDLP